MNGIISVNTGWRTLAIICYHSVQTHHKHQAALCQLQPQPRGPVKKDFRHLQKLWHRSVVQVLI